MNRLPEKKSSIPRFEILEEEIKKYNPDVDLALIKKAYDFSEKAHRGQMRASGEPYFVHPYETTRILNMIKVDTATLAAGLLHDVADDTNITLSDIEKNFNKDIASILDGTSKIGKIHYRGIQRYVENLRKMFLAIAKDVRVVLIKLADRLHNLETLQHLESRKQKRIAEESIRIHANLADRLGIGWLKGCIEDAAFPYLFPKAYKHVVEISEKEFEERRKYAEKVIPEIKKIIEQEKIPFLNIESRAKRLYSLYKKLERYDGNIKKIHDLIAVRMVVPTIEDCYRTLGVIHKHFRPYPGRIKDYIASPKPNGYQSLHTTVFCINNIITEFQIRTEKMHEYAEYGYASHYLYREERYGREQKNLKSDQKPTKQELLWLKQISKWQQEISDSEEFLNSLKIDFLSNRIFVFTPKGDVINLPGKSTPIDFAYNIHTEVGNHIQRAFVNSRLVSIYTTLKNGDVVEVATNPKSYPTIDWLDHVTTSIARSRIRLHLRKKDNADAAETGKKTLETRMRSITGRTLKSVEKKKVEDLLRHFRCENIDELYSKIGIGTISSERVIDALFEEDEILKKNTPSTRMPMSIFRSLKEAVTRKKEEEPQKIRVKGHKGIVFKLGKCCNPKSGDKIVAHITSLKAITIHKPFCEELLKEKNMKKIVEAEWISESKEENFIVLEIQGKNRPSVISDVIDVFSHLGINISSLKSEENEDTLTLVFEFRIHYYDKLRRLISSLRSIDYVERIVRR